MFIDYITVMLVNMAAGLVVLAWFFVRGYGTPGGKAWASGLAMTGVVAFVTGIHMTFAWPITKFGNMVLTWANPAYGETSVLLGILFLGAALAVSQNWSLLPVTLYGCLAGLVAIVLGVRIMDLGLSSAPIPTGIGFILTGLAGPVALAIVLAPGQRVLRWLLAVILAPAVVIWVGTACMAYWMHLEMLSK